MNLSDREILLQTLEASWEKLTPVRLIRRAATLTGTSAADLKTALRNLVDQGDLVYTQQFGSTVVEPSFARPVKVSDHFTLVPPELSGQNESADPADLAGPAGLAVATEPDSGRTLVIEPGISFGSGSHPTTRLCLRAIDRILFTGSPPSLLEPVMAADIGTGSGILAIAAMSFLKGTCVAMDTDLNCVAEARRNVLHNRLESRIRVHESVFDTDLTSPELSLVMANLRLPTLIALSSPIHASTLPGAVLVLSGIRTGETPELLGVYGSLGFKPLDREDEKGWTGVVLKKSL